LVKSRIARKAQRESANARHRRREPGGEEERALKKLADDTADRKVNLIALPFDENRDELFEEIGRANISLMLS
jgi:hypothetical protein